MQDIPFVSSGYRFMVTEAPTLKMREDRKTKEIVPATDGDGNNVYVVMLFAKPREAVNGRRAKGEEIKVTLATDPGEGFEEGDYVELISPVLNTYQVTNDEGRITGSGLWFKALGIKPAGSGAAAERAA